MALSTTWRLVVMGGAALLVCASAAAQEAYKWTDASGTVHYSQQPPPQGTPAAGLTVSQDGATHVQAAVVQKKPKAASGLQDANARQIARMCEVAKGNLAMLQDGGMVTAGDDIATAKQVAPDQRKQKIEAAQTDIKQYCHAK